MVTFFYILISTIIISLGSLIGLVFLVFKQEKIEKYLHVLISLSAGTMIGGAFLHLLPEAQALFGNTDYYYIILISFGVFFLVEKFLHWRHCHDGYCNVHSVGYMNLVGDSVHNFIDGMVIAGAFTVDLRLGIITSVAIALHEIPQEIGDFGVLLYSGFSRQKALLSNFLIATVAVLGGIIGYFLSNQSGTIRQFLLPFAAGGFIYIAMSDLMPELRKEKSLKKSFVSFLIFGLGIFIMWLAKFLGE